MALTPTVEPEGPSSTAHHVPTELVYGPVTSRRFGRSLGISCDWPGVVGCRWRCPYCQLGRQPWDPHAQRPAVKTILTALADRLEAGCDCETLCIAGNGEPTDHPDFAALAAEIGIRGRRLGLTTVLLTNGDGLAPGDARLMAAATFDQVWIKHDPGPAGGAWRQDDGSRIARLAGLGRVRIQAMLYDHGLRRGNAGARDRERWLEELSGMDLAEVHLTTISRPPRRGGLRPVDDATLAAWQRATVRRLACPVATFGRGA